eukprot:TRINITY_DN65213_c0_g1_i1.p1 TRINITY_DN65213_c0_g1~~TRINITY_DN65213_c0_g1_i1.p1  ORF type:complete len:285 (+),score=43.16 TRINITY_DN65213_c0_g1_i1:78-932(+)
MPSMIVYVRDASGDALPVEVGHDATVGSVRAEFVRIKGSGAIPVLTFQGTPLADDSASLADLGICPESTIDAAATQLCVARCGGGTPLCAAYLATAATPEGLEIEKTDESGKGGIAVLFPPCLPGGRAAWRLAMGQNTGTQSAGTHYFGVSTHSPEDWSLPGMLTRGTGALERDEQLFCFKVYNPNSTSVHMATQRAEVGAANVCPAGACTLLADGDVLTVSCDAAQGQLIFHILRTNAMLDAPSKCRIVAEGLPTDKPLYPFVRLYATSAKLTASCAAFDPPA